MSLLHDAILADATKKVGDIVNGYKVTKLDRANKVVELERYEAPGDLTPYLKSVDAAKSYQPLMPRGGYGEIINATEANVDIRTWTPLDIKLAINGLLLSVGVAPPYDPESWYDNGEIVSFNGSLYVVTATTDFRGIAPNAANAAAYWSQPYPASLTAYAQKTELSAYLKKTDQLPAPDLTGYATLQHVDDADAALDTRIDALEARKEVKETKDNITGLPVYSVDGNQLVQPHELQDLDPFNTDARLAALEGRRINLNPYALKVEDLQPVADRVTALEARKEVKDGTTTTVLMDGDSVPQGAQASGFTRDGTGPVTGATTWNAWQAIGVLINQTGQPDDIYEVSVACPAAASFAQIDITLNGQTRRMNQTGLVSGTLPVTEWHDGDWHGMTATITGDMSGSVAFVGFNGSAYIGPVIRKTSKAGFTVDNQRLALFSDIPAPQSADLSNYALKADIPAAPDLTPYALKTELTAEATARAGEDTALGTRVTALETKPVPANIFVGQIGFDGGRLETGAAKSASQYLSEGKLPLIAGFTVTNGATTYPKVAAMWPELVSGANLAVPASWSGIFLRNQGSNSPYAAGALRAVQDDATAVNGMRVHSQNGTVIYVSGGPTAISDGNSNWTNSGANSGDANVLVGDTETRPVNMAVQYFIYLDTYAPLVSIPVNHVVLTTRAVTGSVTGTAYDEVKVPFAITPEPGKVLDTVTATGGAVVSDINPLLWTFNLTAKGAASVISHTAKEAATRNGPQTVARQTGLSINFTAAATSVNFGVALQEGDEIIISGDYGNDPNQSNEFTVKYVKPGALIRASSWPATDHLLSFTFPAVLTNTVNITHGAGNASFRMRAFVVRRDAANGYCVPTGTVVRTPCTVTAGSKTWTLFGGTSSRIQIDPGTGNQIASVTATAGLTVSIADPVTGALEVAVAEGTTSGTITTTTEARPGNLAPLNLGSSDTSWNVGLIRPRNGARIASFTFTLRDRRVAALPSRNTFVTVTMNDLTDGKGNWGAMRFENSFRYGNYKEFTFTDGAVMGCLIQYAPVPGGTQLWIQDLHSNNWNTYGRIENFTVNWEAS